MVLERSDAEMPVVVPSARSTVTVNAVEWLSLLLFCATMSGKSSSSQRSPGRDTQITPDVNLHDDDDDKVRPVQTDRKTTRHVADIYICNRVSALLYLYSELGALHSCSWWCSSSSSARARVFRLHTCS